MLAGGFVAPDPGRLNPAAVGPNGPLTARVGPTTDCQGRQGYGPCPRLATALRLATPTRAEYLLTTPGALPLRSMGTAYAGRESRPRRWATGALRPTAAG